MGVRKRGDIGHWLVSLDGPLRANGSASFVVTDGVGLDFSAKTERSLGNLLGRIEGSRQTDDWASNTGMSLTRTPVKGFG